ncbi:hypothetical protein [uncultured Acetobacteroides sp.]|uniref:hypothetical protein n=1 Tax=uncultured Acetobacteroides sp. TaxID=1760811 RepID=UPI0029F544D7|nr:hypothetical protein [uncultured Acetobacteroides sp.]
MAKVADNIIVKGIRGMLGDMLVFRQLNGQTIVSAKPKKPATRTAKQQEGQERFRLAVAYAKASMGNPQLKELYASRISARCTSAHQVAIADYLNAPRIDAIDASLYKGLAGGTITVSASDNFMVASVQVAIHTADGEVIESGSAAKGTDDRWIYATIQQHHGYASCQITATASDLPGNTAEKTIHLQTVD